MAEDGEKSYATSIRRLIDVTKRRAPCRPFHTIIHGIR